MEMVVSNARQRAKACLQISPQCNNIWDSLAKEEKQPEDTRDNFWGDSMEHYTEDFFLERVSDDDEFEIADAQEVNINGKDYFVVLGSVIPTLEVLDGGPGFAEDANLDFAMLIHIEGGYWYQFTYFVTSPALPDDAIDGISANWLIFLAMVASMDYP